jgi:hypothetical protein
LLDHVVDGDALNEVATALDRGVEPASRARRCPTRAFRCPTASPFSSFETGYSGQGGTSACVAHEWSDWAPARWTSSQQQGYSGPDGGSDQSRRQQIELLLTLLVQLHFWV